MQNNVPKWLFPAMFVCVGIPFILYDASATSDELDALSSTEARQASCVAKIAKADLPKSKAEGMCRCVVAEAEARGITERFGAYDADKIGPVIDLCVQLHVVQ